MVIIGGYDHFLGFNEVTYKYNVVTSQWSSLQTTGPIPKGLYILLIGNLSTAVLEPWASTGSSMFPVLAHFFAPRQRLEILLFLFLMAWHNGGDGTKTIKRKAFNFRLPSMAQEHLYLTLKAPIVTSS